jgi:hypothetical protein
MPTNPIGVIYSKNTLNHTAKDFVKTIIDDW